MKQFIEAIKTRDLTLIEKEFDKIMEAKKAQIIESQRVEIASSIMIEGEEEKDRDDEDMEDEDEDRKDDKKDKEDDE
ncbi:gp67 prohead core protein [Escherichia phage RB49]|uniref:Gp67 prohead core protein n=1 Tax=Escherichia phage RB49 TaxID=50948 RepID=Q7Y447_BPRB4|nr:prohead [Escherichia phage RB49]AAQ15395.1 gp67 prohead core protein [Escherichia phage RB49]